MDKRSNWKTKYSAAISKRYSISRRPQKGSAIIIALGAMMILMLLGSFFLSFATSEYKISKSQVQSIQTYYLTEAGINETIWRLKNDSSWSTCFTSSTASCNCINWTTSTYRDAGSLIPNSSYVMSVKDSGCGNGDLSTQATSTSEGKFNQRIVKIKAYKALSSATKDSPIFSGSASGDIDFTLSGINVYNGNIFSNHDVNITLLSTVNVYDNPSTPTSTDQEGLVFANNNVNVSWSDLNASSSCAENTCESKCPSDSCPPTGNFMPSIDFDSSASSSYKNKATAAQNQSQCNVVGKNSSGSTVTSTSKCLYTSQAFDNLLNVVGYNGTLTLNYKANGSATSTYYVTGPVEIKGGRKLQIYGVLVADGNISIGENNCWGSQCGSDQITVYDPAAPGVPSGILSKNNITFGIYSSFSDTNITGLVYSGNEIDLISLPKNFTVTGGLIANRFSMISVLQPLNFYYDENLINEGIWGGSVPSGGVHPAFSPVITIDHWEEVY